MRWTPLSPHQLPACVLNILIERYVPFAKPNSPIVVPTRWDSLRRHVLAIQKDATTPLLPRRQFFLPLCL